MYFLCVCVDARARALEHTTKPHIYTLEMRIVVSVENSDSLVSLDVSGEQEVSHVLALLEAEVCLCDGAISVGFVSQSWVL